MLVENEKRLADLHSDRNRLDGEITSGCRSLYFGLRQLAGLPSMENRYGW